MASLRKYLWTVGAAISVAFIALGVFFVVTGLDAKATIRAQLAEEKVVTSGDAAIPGMPVADAKTAQAQADVIEKHTVERYGRYAAMERDDPGRDTYLKGLTLRNSLGLAVLGFGVADLAIGTGAVIILLGMATLGLGVQGVYMARRLQPVR